MTVQNTNNQNRAVDKYGGGKRPASVEEIGRAVDDVTRGDTYDVWGPQGKRKIPNAAAVNSRLVQKASARGEPIGSKVIACGKDSEKAWAHVAVYRGAVEAPLVWAEEYVVISHEMVRQKLLWDAIDRGVEMWEYDENQGKNTKRRYRVAFEMNGEVPVPTDPKIQLHLIRQSLTKKLFAEREAVTHARERAQRQVLASEWRDVEEAEGEAAEVEAVAELREESAQAPTPSAQAQREDNDRPPPMPPPELREEPAPAAHAPTQQTEQAAAPKRGRPRKTTADQPAVAGAQAPIGSAADNTAMTAAVRATPPSAPSAAAAPPAAQPSAGVPSAGAPTPEQIASEAAKVASVAADREAIKKDIIYWVSRWPRVIVETNLQGYCVALTSIAGKSTTLDTAEIADLKRLQAHVVNHQKVWVAAKKLITPEDDALAKVDELAKALGHAKFFDPGMRKSSLEAIEKKLLEMPAVGAAHAPAPSPGSAAVAAVAASLFDAAGSPVGVGVDVGVGVTPTTSPTPAQPSAVAS